MRLIVGTKPPLLFDTPLETLRASNTREVKAAFTRAEDALSSGHWIAGYVAYEGVTAIGVFDPPSKVALPAPERAVEHSPLLPLASRNMYDAGVHAVQLAIREGDVYQVNYTLPFALQTIGEPLELYAWYAHRSGARYQAYVEDGNLAILSWSPELFLAFDGARLSTKPMKGTAALNRIDELRSAKNRAEHVMIVDLLRNDLHRICNDVELETFQMIERYPSYATMTSTLSGTVRSRASLSEIFEAMFPCGSVTGAPKRAAIRFIAQLEAQSRGVYCGSIGYLSPRRRGWWNVAIRTAQLDRRSGLGRFDVGGGIVADSRADEEWNEIAVKSSFFRRPANDDLGGGPFAILETFASDADDATLGAHRARLARSAREFGIAFDRRFVEELGYFRSEAGGLVRLRLHNNGATISQKSLEPASEPVPICFSSAAVHSYDPFLRHKTSWRPSHETAAREAQVSNCFDALLCNERSELTEGSRTNLFFVTDGTLWTPPATCGLLPGILRERILSQGNARERRVTAAELRHADAIYVGNSARGLLRAALI